MSAEQILHFQQGMGKQPSSIKLCTFITLRSSNIQHKGEKHILKRRGTHGQLS